MARLTKRQLQALEWVKLAERDQLQQTLVEQQTTLEAHQSTLDQLDAQRQRVRAAARLQGDSNALAQVTQGMAMQYLRQLEQQAVSVIDQVRVASIACDDTVAQLRLAIGELDVLGQHGKKLHAYQRAELARLAQLDSDDAWLMRKPAAGESS